VVQHRPDNMKSDCPKGGRLGGAPAKAHVVTLQERGGKALAELGGYSSGVWQAMVEHWGYSSDHSRAPGSLRVACVGEPRWR
jgi:hypothetical protein